MDEAFEVSTCIPAEIDPQEHDVRATVNFWMGCAEVLHVQVIGMAYLPPAVLAYLAGPEFEEDCIDRARDMARASISDEIGMLNKKAGAYDKAIEECDARKARLLSEAKLPIEGLGLNGDVVTFNGVPFDQCSSAEQLRISTAMAMALNPALKIILIRDGNQFDDDSLALVTGMAEQAGYVVFIERIAGGQGAVWIEGGQDRDAAKPDAETAILPAVK